VNDPVISGVWRPRDRDHYFEHDLGGNIAAIGQWKPTVASIAELISLQRAGTIPPTALLTFSRNVNPATLGAPGGLAAVDDTVFTPIVAWRDSGLVEPTDFTALIDTWMTEFGGVSYVHDAENPPTVAVASVEPAWLTLAPGAPNPIVASTRLSFTLGREARIRLSIFDIRGRKVAVLAEGSYPAGEHAVSWDARRQPAGVYLCRLESLRGDGGTESPVLTRKLAVAR
jgi:hypothetical protein